MFAAGVALALAVSLTITACASSSGYAPGKGRKYVYAYTLVSPTESRSLQYRDPDILVQFRFDDAALRFQVQNLSQEPLSIDWPRVAMGIEGHFVSVRHADNLYADTGVGNSSIAIPPAGYIRDLVIPRGNILFDGRRWVERDLLPTVDENVPALRDSILAFKGKTVALVLPIVVGSRRVMHQFVFRVASVTRIPWKDHRPVQREPAPPPPIRPSVQVDPILMTIIVAGVVGVVTYLTTLAKSSPEY